MQQYYNGIHRPGNMRLVYAIYIMYSLIAFSKIAAAYIPAIGKNIFWHLAQLAL